MPMPMCGRWYEKAGDYRPWHARAEGCTCDASAHAPDDQHDDSCPVNPFRQNRDYDLLMLTGQGAPER